MVTITIPADMSPTMAFNVRLSLPSTLESSVAISMAVPVISPAAIMSSPTV